MGSYGVALSKAESVLHLLMAMYDIVEGAWSSALISELLMIYL